MILSAQSIRRLCEQDPPLINPFVGEKTIAFGVSFGLGPAGYDVRVREALDLSPGDFILASTVEGFHVPSDVIGIVHDKSTWARLGLAAQNTVIESGWKGDSLTLEISNHGKERVRVNAGSPIVQIIFHWLDQPTDRVYAGKYQNAPEGPQLAIMEGDNVRK